MRIYKTDEIKELASVAKEGKIIAFPTETVFGLGAISSSKDAFEKLVEVKKRPPEKPFTLMCSNIKQIEKYADFAGLFKKIAEIFAPGPITFIVKSKEFLPSYLTLDTGWIGIRIPDDKNVLKLINEVGEPLLVPSANISGEPPAMSTEEIISIFDGKIDGVLEGTCVSGKPSTIIKIDGDNIILIREGELKLSTILEAVKWKFH